MRRGIVCLLALLVAGLAASSVHAQARPLRPGDAALLKRKASYEELVAEYVGARLTRLRPSVRCGPLGISAASPVGRAVIGRRKGEVALVEAPRRKFRLEIVSIEPAGS